MARISADHVAGALPFQAYEKLPRPRHVTIPTSMLNCIRALGADLQLTMATPGPSLDVAIIDAIPCMTPTRQNRFCHSEWRALQLLDRSHRYCR